jgi:hypothetical protein
MNEPVKPVKQWYTGKEIVDDYGIKDFQLFDLMKAGVHVRTTTGKKVVDSDSLPKERKHSLKYYEKLAQLEIGTEQTGKVITGRGGVYNRPKRSDDEIMQDFQRQYYSQPEEILNDPKGCESISFNLPDDDVVRITAIKKTLSFQFKAVDVIKFFKDEENRPLLSEKIQNKTADPKKQERATGGAIMGLPEKHYFTIDDLTKRWECNEAYLEYLLETRKPNGERLLDAEYKESPYPLERLEPGAQDRFRRLVVHPFPFGKVPPGEIIIMREEVERFEREHGITKGNGIEPEQAEVQTESRRWIYGYDICHIYDVKDSELWEAVKSGRLTPYTNTGEKIDIDKWKGSWDLHIKEAKRILTSIATQAKQQGMTINDVDVPPESIQFIHRYNKKNFILEARNFSYRKDTEEFKVFLKELTGDVESLKASQYPAPQEIEPLKESVQQKHTSIEQRKAVNFFTREEDKHWRVGFNGKERIIDPLDGVHYIAILLETPGKSISCRDLFQSASGKTPDKVMSEGAAIDEGLQVGSSKQSISSGKERKIYLEKYRELKDKLRDASMEEQEEIKEQMAKIMPYLKKRNFADPNDKKAQVNMKKRLNTAYKAIRESGMKEMAKHLQDNIKTDDAYGLRYTGDIAWEIIIK